MRRPVLRAASLSLLLGLSSCFTAALWGFDSDTRQNVRTGRDEAFLSYDEDTEWSWPLLGLRVLGTPFAVALDCLTWPLQVFLWADEDGDLDAGYHIDQRR
jgi:hypothetical protein